MATPEDAARRWARSVIGSTRRDLPPEDHLSWVSPGSHWRGGDQWRARCECGWFGTPRPSFAEAEADRQTHRVIVEQTTLF